MPGSPRRAVSGGSTSGRSTSRPQGSGRATSKGPTARRPPKRSATPSPPRRRASGQWLIAVNNQQRQVRFSAGEVRRVVQAALQTCGVRRAEISVALVNDAVIHEINRKFLGHDYPTDVISFGLDDPELSDGPDAVAPPDAPPRTVPQPNRPRPPQRRRGEARAKAVAPPAPPVPVLSGEVVASAEMAVRRAAEFAWTPERELALYLIHGTLHLCGHEDQTPAQRRRMRAAEDEVLQSLGWRRPGGGPA